MLSIYYGMLRIGKATYSKHVLKAKDVYLGKNKNKILFVLHTSKTHTRGSKPQLIKLVAQNKENSKDSQFCPFRAASDFSKRRRHYESDCEQFFIYRDGSPVTPPQLRSILKQLIKIAKIDPKFYSVHCIRAGRMKNLFDMGVSVETIIKIGRWKSSAVYTYLKY